MHLFFAVHESANGTKQALLWFAEARCPRYFSLKEPKGEETNMHKLNVILIIALAFALTAPCTALAGTSLNYTKIKQTYTEQKPDGVTKRPNNPSTGSAIKRGTRR